MQTKDDRNPGLTQTGLVDSTAAAPADTSEFTTDPAGNQPETPNPKLETPTKDARRRHWNKFVRRGRPSTFNEDVADAMYESILEAGVTDSRAALLANVSTSTVSRWKQHDPSFADFLETARAEFEIEEVKKIRHAKRRDGQYNPQNSKWLLERTNPEVWGRHATRPPASAHPSRTVRGVPQRDANLNAQQSNSTPNIPEIAPANAASPTRSVDAERDAQMAEHAATHIPAMAESPNHQSPPFRVAQQSKIVPIIPEIPSGHSCVSFAAGSVAVPNLNTDLAAILARRKQERKGLSRAS